MEPKLDRLMGADLDPELRPGLNRWASYILIALAIFSAQILFDLAKINVNTWTTSTVYATSVAGIFYLYLAAAKFAISDRKNDSAAEDPPVSGDG